MERAIFFLGCTHGMPPNEIEGVVHVSLEMTNTTEMMKGELHYQLTGWTCADVEKLAIQIMTLICREGLAQGYDASALDYAYFSLGTMQ